VSREGNVVIVVLLVRGLVRRRRNLYIFSIHLQTPGDHSVVLRRYENSCLFNYQRKCLERLRFGFHFCSLRDQGISYFANKLLSTHYNIIDTYSSIGFDCKGLLLWSHYHGFHRSSGVEKDPACRALYLHFLHIELFLFGRILLAVVQKPPLHRLHRVACLLFHRQLHHGGRWRFRDTCASVGSTHRSPY